MGFRGGMAACCSTSPPQLSTLTSYPCCPIQRLHQVERTMVGPPSTLLALTISVWGCVWEAICWRWVWKWRGEKGQRKVNQFNKEGNTHIRSALCTSCPILCSNAALSVNVLSCLNKALRNINVKDNNVWTTKSHYFSKWMKTVILRVPCLKNTFDIKVELIRKLFALLKIDNKHMRSLFE